MRDVRERVCLIIPCYNEAARLKIEKVSELPSGVTCVFVNDGSADGTADLIRRHLSSSVHLLDLATNSGKAEAVRQGMLHAQRTGLLEGSEWVGYWDADMATPFAEVSWLIAYASLFEGRVDGVIGSRVYKLGSTIERSYGRHLLGRSFATLTRALLGLKCYDSQCGAKLFRTELVETAFAEPFLSRWIFDLEVLLRLRGCNLIECPLREWSDAPGSKIRVLRLALPTFLDIVRIRRRYVTGGIKTVAERKPAFSSHQLSAPRRMVEPDRTTAPDTSRRVGP